ncbi:MAG: sodium:proton antiporter [Oscillospiraceae bacterium]|nr:sodium:proton antiporter [Oscillospiraceae bacterium]
MEWLILGVFSISLLICIISDIPVLYALSFGLFLFLFYGRKKGFSWHELLGMAFNGIKTVSNILITFLFIGVMTAFWRAGGTISAIVCYTSGMIRPTVFLLMTFLLNSVVSVLTGTSFGTAATMGVICTTMGSAMNVSPILSGGAVLSGVFVGDRCSPVSTSALLVAAVTDTDIYRNIRHMVRSALLPFILTCFIYLIIGFRFSSADVRIDLEGVFSKTFVLHWIALLPAVVILLFSVCRVNVRIAMAASIVSAVPLCLFLQKMSVVELLKVAVIGFHPIDADVAAMVSGGGIFSMFRVAGIVCLSSSYSGIFQKTGLLDRVQAIVLSAEEKTTAFISVLGTSILAGMIACNQTLTILLVNQLCGDGYQNKEQLALDLEDTAVVIAPLIPWSIAGGVPLSTIGAPIAAITAAVYLILLPLWRAFQSWREKKISLL